MLFGAPVDEVAGVEGDAQEVGRNEAELSGLDADHADEDDSGDHARPGGEGALAGPGGGVDAAGRAVQHG